MKVKLIPNKTDAVVEQPSPVNATGIAVSFKAPEGSLWHHGTSARLHSSTTGRTVQEARRQRSPLPRAALLLALEIPSTLLNATKQRPLRMPLTSAQQTNSGCYFLCPGHCHTPSPRTVIFK